MILESCNNHVIQVEIAAASLDAVSTINRLKPGELQV